jgi:uncharacterized membrane protein YfhO
MSKRKLEACFTGLVTLLFGFYLVEALKMPFGGMSEPGSGFVPVVIAVIGLLISLGLTLKNVWSKAVEKLETFTRQEILRIIGYLIVLVVFVSAFKTLGIAIIFLTVLALSKISALQGWFRPVVLASGATLGVYVLFYVLLDVPLPLGPSW